MGAGPSKPRPYPFPVPTVSSSGMQTSWSSVRTKKGKEKAHPELYQQYQYPNGFPTAAYGFQYHSQAQSAYPQISGYYPVAMVPMQQPLVMPQSYVPVAAFQNAVHQPPGPVFPSVIPSSVPQVHMPEPSIPTNNQGPAMPDVTGRRDPVVPPPPVMANVQPQRDTAFPPPPIINDTHYSSQSQPTARMPEPHVGNRRATPGPVRPDMTGRRGDPVVPPPPVVTDAQRAANSSSRPRFTDFYQPADHPISMPEPPPPVITDAQRAANSSSRPRFTDFYQPADHPISMPEPVPPVMPDAQRAANSSSRPRFTDFYQPADHPISMPEPVPPVIPDAQRAANSSSRPRFTDFHQPADHPMSMPEPAPSVIPDAQRATNSSSRPRFTDFYQPADHPISMPEPYLSDVPFRPPTVPPIRMATRRNPLPPPPRDIWETTPYRQVLQELPKDITLSLNVEHMEEMENMLAQPAGPISRLGNLFGSSSKRKGKSRKGLFRAFSTSGSDSESGGRHHRSNTVTSFVIPPAAVMPHGINTYTGSGAPLQAMPVPDRGPPIKFDHTGELSGFVNHSEHRVLYKNKMFPTAMHLLEAMKFTEHPDLQERIRTCTDVGDMYPLSASLQDHVRPDWGQVFLKIMEEVLYIKFKQHPSLRTLLLRTGLADLVYADANDTYWGHGPSGDGANELGKALMRVRDRLHAEGGR